ncbi:MAG: hypothetical protein JW982_08345 [Spirochaetes bacterium]|nr:hypothetical protein [Spirochaetota bacterium]
MKSEQDSGKFICFDEKFITDFLLKQPAPVMESVLLNAVCNQHKLTYIKKDLFYLHFSLFHALYKIKLSYGAFGYFLNIDTMRIRLLKLPESGCLFYHPEKGTYCGNDIYAGNSCKKHGTAGNADLYFDILQEFYLNPENINFDNDRVFQKILRGYTFYSFNSGKVNDALAFFNIKKTEISKIKKIYHDLAKKHHPDVSSDNGEMMKKINYHYQILNELVSL